MNRCIIDQRSNPPHCCLWFRLDVVCLWSHRRGDLIDARQFGHFRRKLARQDRLEPTKPTGNFFDTLLAHDYLGNVRELENMTEPGADAPGQPDHQATRTRGNAGERWPRPLIASPQRVPELGTARTQLVQDELTTCNATHHGC